MSKLCLTLPPFAPDYSGAASALYELGGMIIIHDASGCTGNYTGFDEPRWFDSPSAVFCSGLRHMDAVLGNDEKFINRIVETAKSLNPTMIAILGSPVPMVIGTDLKGMAHEIEAVSGIPAIGLDTKGLACYGQGIGDITIALLKRFAAPAAAKLPDSINLLGMTPLDFYINGNERDFCQLFRSHGITVTSCYYMGLTIEDISKSTSASLNVVVSQAGISVAEYMKKRFDIPYIVGTPLGDGRDMIAKTKIALSDNFSEYIPYIPQSGAADTLIIGEQVISNSIREYLQVHCGHGPIDVAALYDVTSVLQAKTDINVKNELHLRRVLASGQYCKVIGDPEIKKLIRDQSAAFHPLAHVALSSKLHWHECKAFISHDMVNWLESI